MFAHTVEYEDATRGTYWHGGTELIDMEIGWRSPFTMPRFASRITLEIVGVRVERLQSIAECDCEKTMGYKIGELGNDAYQKFREWWDAQHGQRHQWSANPWCWVLDVKRVEQL